MNNEQQPSRVTVNFRKSSSKEGGEGYEITVMEGATYAEAQRIYDIAVALRAQAVDELKPPSLSHQLEVSIADRSAANL